MRRSVLVVVPAEESVVAVLSAVLSPAEESVVAVLSPVEESVVVPEPTTEATNGEFTKPLCES